jgi:GntR family transcriptional regulator
VTAVLSCTKLYHIEQPKILGGHLLTTTKTTRVAKALESEILSGSLRKGDGLASEHALVRRFSVSRNTVRRSLEILSAKGLIATTCGVGSFVTYDGAVIDTRSGWRLALSEHGARTAARILRLARATSGIAGAPLPESTDCLCIDRLRFREETGVAISLERARIPWRDRMEPVLSRGLTEGSLTRTLEEAGLVPVGGEEWVHVLPALSAADAAILGRAPGSPMLRTRRLTRMAGGEVVEFVESLLDPDLFGLHVEF